MPADFFLALGEVLADEVVELGGAERLLERLAAAERAEEPVGAEQVLVVEDDVVDADDLVLAQSQVVEVGPGLVQVHAEGVVRVVVEVRPGGDDPVDEPGLDRAGRGTTCPARPA